MFLDVDYNPNNRTYQYYLNNIKQYQYSLFANGVILCTQAPTSTATDLEFGADTISIVAGTSENVPVTTVPPQSNSTITYSISAEKIGGESVSAGSVATVQASSSDPKVAVVTGVAAGTCTLTASAESGSVTDTIAVTITAAS
jgi:hypothetical protein